MRPRAGGATRAAATDAFPRRPTAMAIIRSLAIACTLGSAFAALEASSAAQTQTAPIGSTSASLGGSFVSPMAPPMTAMALNARILEITLNLPGQTWSETFIIGIPHGVTGPAPVLALFHGYGESPDEVLANTDLVTEALARGWVVFIPHGAHDYNYGIDYAQENIELTFDLIAARLPIDPERIYAVGFSMGGGAALSFAARHLDPLGPRFAAVVNHTGSTSLRSSYHASPNKTVFESPLMFGGTPAQEPFRYLRSSSIDHDAFTGALIPDDHMALNLERVPVRNTYAIYDQNLSLVDQTLALHDYLGNQGGTTLEVPLNASAHAWSTLDATAVLDWLEPQRLDVPELEEIVRLRPDRDGRWHDVGIELRDANAFGELLYSSRPSIGALYLIGSENLETVEADLPALGLGSNGAFVVMTQAVDGEAPTLRLGGLGGPPTAVSYAGSAAGTWSYDAQSDEVVLEEPGAAAWARWTILP